MANVLCLTTAWRWTPGSKETDTTLEDVYTGAGDPEADDAWRLARAQRAAGQ
jgi:hypothetical protein